MRRQKRGAPSSVFRHADGHPTFLVLLDTRRLVGRNLLDRFLVHHKVSVGESLGSDDLAIDVSFTPIGKLFFESFDF